MEKRVVHRDRQELQAIDLNSMQEFTALSLQHICQDAVGSGLFYSGLQTSLHSPTEVRISSGRFWQDGKVYTRDVDVTQANLQSDTYSLFNFLPATHKRLIAVLAFGQENETDVQPRDFLINLETGATEPNAVPMQLLRLCNINLLPGVESPVPQMPVVPAGTILVATVLLGTTGIESIQMNGQGQIPSTNSIQLDITQLLLWKSLIEPILDSIRSDLAALWDAVGRAPSKDFVSSLAGDVAYLKEKEQLPDSFSNYAADIFDSIDESDTANVAYSALILDGLRFATESQTSMNLALFNPNDPNVSRRDTLILPKFESVLKFSTSKFAGELSLSSQFQTINYSLAQGYEYSYRYGWTVRTCGGWWTGRESIDVKLVGSYYHYTRNYQKTWGDVQQITGSLVSQTILISNAMWLTEVGLFFTALGATGDVTLVISETEHGKPELKKSFAIVTVPRADLKQYPQETRVQIPPVFLNAGGRYAFTLITQGSHRSAVSSNSRTYTSNYSYTSSPGGSSSSSNSGWTNSGPYSEGTLFTGTDGEYFAGNLEKDLMVNLYAAKFLQTRTEIPLQSLSLAGGMTNISVDSKQIIPDGCEVHFEFQKDGIWRRMGDATFHLQSKPDLLPMRALLIGTSDLAPQIELKTNGLKGWRSLSTFTHLSTLRTLAAASASITVKVDVLNFNPANHTITCQLRKIDNSLVNATVTTSTVENTGDADIRRFKFTFALSPTLTQYRIQLNGGRNSINVEPFVALSRVDVAA